MGGAVQIFRPDFETNSASNLTNSHPYIYIHGNKFEKNMAYFAGNALFVSHTVSVETSYFEDYRMMCGAGVLIDQNHFVGNIGLKRHNGGATVN